MYTKTVTKSFENVARFKYLGTIVKTQNYIYKEAEQIRFKKCITMNVFYIDVKCDQSHVVRNMD
jgi:hypothetical protein